MTAMFFFASKEGNINEVSFVVGASSRSQRVLHLGSNAVNNSLRVTAGKLYMGILWQESKNLSATESITVLKDALIDYWSISLIRFREVQGYAKCPTCEEYPNCAPFSTDSVLKGALCCDKSDGRLNCQYQEWGTTSSKAR